MDPMQNLNNAADALNQVAQRAGAFWDQADAQIAQRQAAYDALGANLAGVVAGEMNFHATWDPSEVNPNNNRNGTFSSLQTLLNKAPQGAHVQVNLVHGKRDYEITSAVTIKEGQVVTLMGSNANRPQITHRSNSYDASETVTYNKLAFIALGTGSSLRGVGIDFELEGKADAAAGWASSSSAFWVASHGSGIHNVGFMQCSFTGSDGVSIIKPYVGNIVGLGMYACTLDGAMYGLGTLGGGSGIGLPALYSVAFTNGAQLSVNGVNGTNMLEG